MKALLGFNYAKDNWCIYAVFTEDIFAPSLESIKKRLTEDGKYLFPEWCIAPIKSYTFSGDTYSAEIDGDFEFPDVVTLAESIKINQKILHQSRH